MSLRLFVLARLSSAALVLFQLFLFTGCEPEPSSAGASFDAASLDSAVSQADAGDDASSLTLDGTAADAASQADASSASALMVRVRGGELRGNQEGTTRLFLGVPYGAPATGALRFAPPQPAAAWQGVRDATAYANDCMQPDQPGDIPKLDVPRSEDCLYLNVWTPSQPARGGAPVFVHLLGGAWTYGGGGDVDGRLLSEATGAVVVAPNFRQGALGFLVHEALDKELGVPSGNLATRDQQLALRWIQDNIAVFGGDATRVTLYGQSSGAQSTCLHWLSPGSRALVQRYIMQSGSCVEYRNVPLDRAKVAKVSQELTNELCAGRSDIVTCLRELPAEKIALWGVQTLRPIGESFFPQVDGDVLPMRPLELLEKGMVNPAPILLGSVPHEWAVVNLYGGKEVPRPKTLLELWFYLWVFFEGGTGDVIDYYAPLGTPDDQAEVILERVMSDMMFHCPARALARRASAAGTPVYLYSFELMPGVHGIDIDYLFGYPWVSPLMKPPLYEQAAPVPLDAPLVRTLQSYAGNFMRSGDPNGEGLTVWPRYHATRDEHLTLDRNVQAGSALHDEVCTFWDGWHERWDNPR